MPSFPTRLILRAANFTVPRVTVPRVRITSRVWIVALTFAVMAASAILVLETLRLPQFAGPQGRQAALTFVGMLGSLAGVVVAMILPDRLSRPTLALGGAGFLACIGYALATGVRF